MKQSQTIEKLKNKKKRIIRGNEKKEKPKTNKNK